MAEDLAPNGAKYNIPPRTSHPFWTDEEIKENITATATVDNTTGTPSVDVTKNGYNFNFTFKNLKGEKGDQGPEGPAGKDGSDANIDRALTGISITNENGIYGISETKGDGSMADVGSIEMPNIDNVIAEVNDSVVENTSAGYDYHTIKETEHNGTQNDVGSFYIARKQITALNADGSFTTVDQAGQEGTGQINLSTGFQAYQETTADGVSFSSFNQTINVASCTSDSRVIIAVRSSNAVRLATRSEGYGTTYNFVMDAQRSGYNTTVTAGSLVNYPQLVIPLISEALEGTSKVIHSIYGINKMSLQRPVLVLSCKPVFNDDGSATFTVSLYGFYMDKVDDITYYIGNNNSSSYPIISSITVSS